MKKSWTIIRCYLFIVVSLIICLLLFSCKTIKYVPVVEQHTEIVHHYDTIKQIDSVKNEIKTIIRESRPEDSLMLAEMGIKLQSNERLLILLQRELAEKNSEKYESHNKDSVRVDSVEVPVPVEKKLSKWEQFTLDYGKVAFGGTLIAIAIIIFELIRWLRRRDK